MLKAGFAEADITAQAGCAIIGWLREVRAMRVADPLYARAAVFECGDRRIGFLHLDILSIRWKQVAEIRRRTSEMYGLPEDNLLVAATHNHAGPAVINCGEVRRDDAYIAVLVDKAVAVVGEA